MEKLLVFYVVVVLMLCLKLLENSNAQHRACPSRRGQMAFGVDQTHPSLLNYLTARQK
jgi:hypothetical protein